MFGALDGQFANGVVMDHLRNTAERLAELTENESAVTVDDLHVHEATRTPTTTASGEHRRTRLVLVCLKLLCISCHYKQGIN